MHKEETMKDRQYFVEVRKHEDGDQKLVFKTEPMDDPKLAAEALKFLEHACKDTEYSIWPVELNVDETPHNPDWALKNWGR